MAAIFEIVNEKKIKGESRAFQPVGLNSIPRFHSQVIPEELPMFSRRLIYKPELRELIGCSYSTVWQWMRDGKFPRSVAVGGKSAWYLDEVEAWLEALPRRRLKGDDAISPSPNT